MHSDLLKFKVWCLNKKEWEKDSSVIGPDGQLYWTKGLIPAKMENHIVEKCTGRNDINGTLIYGGDIVEHCTVVGRIEEDGYVDVIHDLNGYKELATAEHDGTTFIYAIVTGSVAYLGASGFMICSRSGLFYHHYGGQNLLWRELKVVGNIYENIELLESKDEKFCQP